MNCGPSILQPSLERWAVYVVGLWHTSKLAKTLREVKALIASR